MEVFNKVTEEVVTIDNDKIKDILEWILITSSKGVHFVNMSALPGCKENFFIVSEAWMNESRESSFNWDRTNGKIKSLEEALQKINHISSSFKSK